MVVYKWVIPNTLAVSPMPDSNDIEDIVSRFKCAVILATSEELRYDINRVVKAGLKVLRKPTPDFTVPNIIDLHEIVEFIDSCNKPVLVHCFGGRG